MPPARATFCRSLPVGISRDLCPVPAYIHAAPHPRALLARVVKMQDTAIAFSNARCRRNRQQIDKSIRERRVGILRDLWREMWTALKTRIALNDLLQVGMSHEQTVKAFDNARQDRITMLHRKNRLASGFPKLQKVVNAGRKIWPRPTTPQARGLALVDQAGRCKPPRQGAAIGQHLRRLTVHNRPRVDEIQQQVVAQEQKSVSPVIVHIQTHPVTETKRLTKNFPNL
jgi:hypothetical protein